MIEETTLHKDGSSADLNIALGKEGEKKKNKSYYNTGYSHLIAHPRTNPSAGLSFVEWTKHVAVFLKREKISDTAGLGK